MCKNEFTEKYFFKITDDSIPIILVAWKLIRFCDQRSIRTYYFKYLMFVIEYFEQIYPIWFIFIWCDLYSHFYIKRQTTLNFLQEIVDSRRSKVCRGDLDSFARAFLIAAK